MAAVAIMASEGATYNCDCIHINKKKETATVESKTASERHTETISKKK